MDTEPCWLSEYMFSGTRRRKYRALIGWRFWDIVSRRIEEKSHPYREPNEIGSCISASKTDLSAWFYNNFQVHFPTESGLENQRNDGVFSDLGQPRQTGDVLKRFFLPSKYTRCDSGFQCALNGLRVVLDIKIRVFRNGQEHDWQRNCTDID